MQSLPTPHSVLRHPAGVRAWIFDVDGTLAMRDPTGSYAPLPGAAEVIRHLRRRQVPFLVFTNGSHSVPAEQAAALRAVGLEVDAVQFVTPSTVAADFFWTSGLRRVLVIGVPGASQPLRERGLEVVDAGEESGRVDAVYLGSARQFSAQDLDFVCHAVIGEAPLFVSTDVPIFAAQGRPAINFAGAMAAAVTHITGRQATVLGKPAAVAIAYCARRLNCSTDELGIVGDDPQLEVRMAREHGAFAVGLTSGICSAEQFRLAIEIGPPDLLLANVGDLLPLLRDGEQA